MRLVTLNPARAVGLAGERGSLELGKQAGLILVDPSGPAPVVELTLRAGEIAHHAPRHQPRLTLVRSRAAANRTRLCNRLITRHVEIVRDALS